MSLNLIFRAQNSSNFNLQSILNVWTINMVFYFSITLLAYKTNYITQNSAGTYRKKTENKIHKVHRPINKTVSIVTDLQAKVVSVYLSRDLWLSPHWTQVSHVNNKVFF